ncbi:hypothetical protein MN116_005502 [Schistosoma mekongi]|uniref:Uncharacterized protein n=1 Tax=Schistosoma mekongi TaxID=38744 RepID=A0AAE1ZCA9_SCHME|nr:hypothetical protein MN116_005502 [Schistosoma mekongi]
MNRSTTMYNNHLQSMSNEQILCNNNNNNNNTNNKLCNSPTLSTYSAPFINYNTKQNTLLQSSIHKSNMNTLSMLNVKELLDRLKIEVELERNKRTLIARQRSQDIYKLTTRSKVENRLLIYALKHAENKAKMYRNEYYKLKTKVQGKYINSEQQNPKMSIVNDTIDNNEVVLNGQTSLNTQSTSTVNRNVCFA